MFLVGKDIPDNIRTLPQRFLETPIGQMLRVQIDQSMRSMTQAPDAEMPVASTKQPVSGYHASSSSGSAKNLSKPLQNGTYGANLHAGQVHKATSSQEIDFFLASARNSCAVIFFTSATCAPCKILYPPYDELAAEAGDRAVFIKVDLNEAIGVGVKYHVRATPTFMTFLNGQKENEWSGANEAKLRGNVRLLIQMAWPAHPHSSLRLPTFQRKITEPVFFRKVPPLDRLTAKIGPLAEEEAFSAVVDYIKHREAGGRIEAPLPNLHSFADIVATRFEELPPETHFALVDLVRIAAADARVSAFFATERNHRTILILIPPKREPLVMPYNLQVVTLQLACNLFTSPIFAEQLISNQASNLLRMALESLASTCLLAKHSNTRFLASALVYNLALVDHNSRMEGEPDKLNIGAMDNLEAALVEAVINERESKETLHGLLLALGMLLYSAELDGSILELCSTMDVKEALLEKRKMPIFREETLIREIGEELLEKGGRR